MRFQCFLAAWALATASLESGFAAGWLPDLNTAKAQAASTGRPILMLFTGSDWCPACKQVRATVLDSAEFRKFADERLILVEIDFPRYRPVSQLQRQANQQLAEQYQITAFPTFLLVNFEGKLFRRVPSSSSPGHFIGQISSLIPQAPGASSDPRLAHQGLRGSGSSSAGKTDLPLFGGATTRPVSAYTNLVLKSITGKPGRRFALINSETLASGDSALLKIGGEPVRVHCVAVDEGSVRVRVSGESGERELRLAGTR